MSRRFGPLTAVAAAFLLLTNLHAADKDKGDKDEEKDPFAELIGKPAPDFAGDFSVNGRPVKVSDLKGKVVLLDFWAVWCPPCVASFPHLRKLSEEHHDDGLEVIGVTKYYERFSYDKEKDELTPVDEDKKLSREDEQNMLKDFAAHYKLPYRLMTVSKDAEKKIDEDYKNQGIPEMVLIDRKGVVRMVKLGYLETPEGLKETEALDAKVQELLKEKE